MVSQRGMRSPFSGLVVLCLVRERLVRLKDPTFSSAAHVRWWAQRTSFTKASRNVSRKVCTAFRRDVLS